jgi:ubiquinone/menaquinone biosynthesis C-methylase UbiE
VVDGLDGANFGNNTIWEGEISSESGFNYIYGKSGRQYICDATNLNEIKSNTYDFLLSSNCLEHVANPMKALGEWRRVLINGGHILLVLPNKKSNFDHNRPVTSFEHIIEDYRNNIAEDDLTHLDEILQLHDLSLDPPAGTLEQFKFRSMNNFNNRTLHHHIFDTALMTKMLAHFNFEVIKTDVTATNMFALAKKT